MNIPALRGEIGGTIYYTSNLKFSQIANLVKRIDNELHTSLSLKDEIQRALSDNYIKIKQYILTQSDHFFNALVLAVYDGQPEWTEIRYELNDEMFSDVGILHFNGNEKIFPVDGQHRVEGIKAALKENPDLSDETIAVILIGHKSTPEGMEKSRRIFSTLNRYAKPVRLGDIIALDEDDIVAITTRIQLEENSLFEGARIKSSNSKSIPASDQIAFTTLMTLYDCHLELFKLYKFNGNVSANKLKDYQRIRPEENEISNFNAYLAEFWNKMVLYFPELSQYLKDKSVSPAARYRNSENGGSLLFRPVALLPFVSAIMKIGEKYNIEEILRNISKINRCISSPLWEKIIWNPATRKMIMRNQSVVKGILIHMYDSELLSSKDKEVLYSKYALIHNITELQAKDRINKLTL
ncbi:MAG: DGQHR domain-containing protein [Bacteroides sp.]|nr:DGQHR domain-containing protein [Bacteroides sp.]